MSPPEIGQRVHLRGGAYVVQEAAGTPAVQHTDGTKIPGTTHLRLASLQEDAFGASLEVIWELEPGAQVREDKELPDPVDGELDPPGRLDAFLDAVRWGAVVQADHNHIQAPFRGGVIPEPYQLDPVVRAVAMPRANLLIADDVGLGKTIEAGLVIQELLIRGKARSILIICPSSLQVQWREQMHDKFGLDFHIVNRDYLKDLRRRQGPRANPWNSYPRLITSIDYIKRPNPSRLLADVLRTEHYWQRDFDVLVVDEAHCLAPTVTGRYVVDSQRTRIVRKLSNRCQHKLFLTATPHNGNPTSWTALLELLDDQRFTRGIKPDLDQRNRVVIRRMKSQILNELQVKRFKDRVIRELVVPYTDEERLLYDYFKDYAASRCDRAHKEQMAEYAVTFTLKLLKKRLFSSPGAFWKSIERHAERMLSRKPREAHVARSEKGLRLLQRYLDGPDEDHDNDEAAESSAYERLDYAGVHQPDLTESERQLLRALKAGAKQAQGGPDSKASLLLDWLQAHLRPGGKWSRERVIIFTEYRDTMKWLIQLLESRGLSSRTATIYGGMPAHEREGVKNAFQAHPDTSDVRILLATDAAGEGLDLQNHCRYLIHYEIPWNPNRLEQRNGRIDRHGQTREPHIFHFVGQNHQKDRDPLDLRAGDLEGDLEFLYVAAHKIERIREDLGVVGPVIAQNIEDAMLGRRHTLDTRRAEEAAEANRGNLSFELDLRKRIAELEEQYFQTRNQLGLTPAAIQNAVCIGLDLARKPPLQPVRLARGGHQVYRLPELSGGWAECAQGLAHPHTGVVRPVSFDPEVALGHDDVVLIHLGHKLVRLCLRLLRAEVWNVSPQRRLKRMCARVVPAHAYPGKPHVMLLAHARLLITGATQQRLHEELVVAGGTILDGAFRVCDDDGLIARLLQAAGTRQPADAVCARLAELYPNHKGPLRRALTTRVKRRAGKLARQIEAHKTNELEKVRDIFATLAEALDQKLLELGGAPDPQLELPLGEEEVVQYRADIAALKRRREFLPEERAHELSATAARYQDPLSKFFPVSVTWLVPDTLAR